jgi:DNA mismatch repair protein MutS2
VERLLGELRKRPTQEEARAAYQELAALREEARAREETVGEKEEAMPLPPAEIEVGRLVHVRSVDADGRIVHLSPRGKVTVDLDGVRVLTEPADLERPRAKEEPKAPPSRIPRLALEPVSLELNVRGLTVSEALREVQLYLDRLLLADVCQASILHGKGTGALREAIRGYLASLSFVASFRSASPPEGGDGVTVFEIEGD